MKKLTTIILVIFISIIMLLIAVKGSKNGMNYFAITKDSSITSPFEATNSTSRYLLTEAIVEDGTLFLNDSRAQLATPDTGYYNGKYFSLFTPGVSFFGVPFYYLGRELGYPQIVTYLSTTFLAILNVLLIYFLARKIGVGFYASILSGFLFLFATNSFSYSLSFTQHELSACIILLSLLTVFGKNVLVKNILLGILFGAGILVDIPNMFLLSPILLYSLSKDIVFNKDIRKISLKIKTGIIGFVIGVIPLLMIFGWYNFQLTSSYTSIPQMMGRVEYGSISNSPLPTDGKLVFDPRRQINGLYILLLSDERSWLFYSPIIFVGILGIITIYRKRSQDIEKYLPFLGVVVVNILIYSMFGDPWGGWSFGARYLIPSAAVLSIFIGVTIQRYKKNPIFIILFLIVIIYSIYINILGGFTTNSIPPRGESQNLTEPIPYTYEYNIQLAKENRSSSYTYNNYIGNSLPLENFIILYSGAVVLVSGCLYIFAFFSKEEGKI